MPELRISSPEADGWVTVLEVAPVPVARFRSVDAAMDWVELQLEIAQDEAREAALVWPDPTGMPDPAPFEIEPEPEVVRPAVGGGPRVSAATLRAVEVLMRDAPPVAGEADVDADAARAAEVPGTLAPEAAPTAPPSRMPPAWTAEEDAELLSLAAQGMGWKDICERINVFGIAAAWGGRTPGSCQQRKIKLDNAARAAMCTPKLAAAPLRGRP